MIIFIKPSKSVGILCKKAKTFFRLYWYFFIGKVMLALFKKVWS